MIDIEAFEERAAILEYDAGFSRFRAETMAAAAQGKRRDEVFDEIRRRNLAAARDRDAAMARQQRPGSMPGMQPVPKEEARSVSERQPNA